MSEGEFAPFIEGMIMAAEHGVLMLKPCPFCDSTELEPSEITDTAFTVYCNKCHSSGPEGVTMEEAIRKWNRRVNE